MPKNYPDGATYVITWRGTLTGGAGTNTYQWRMQYNGISLGETGLLQKKNVGTVTVEGRMNLTFSDGTWYPTMIVHHLTSGGGTGYDGATGATSPVAVDDALVPALLKLDFNPSSAATTLNLDSVIIERKA